MFGSAFLEVVIGVSFVYFLLSLVCTALNEMLSQILGLRARNLEIGRVSIPGSKACHRQQIGQPDHDLAVSPIHE
jgi:hypothetical protein